MQERGRMVAYANKEIPNLPDEAVPDREQNILQERGRMVAYTNEEIPNLPDEAVPVIRQREENIFVQRLLCKITFSIIFCVLFAILFAVFLFLYIKLNGDYKDIQDANGRLIEENKILNNTLQSLLKAINKIPNLRAKNVVLANELDNIEEKVLRLHNKDLANPYPLLGFITLESNPTNGFRKYIWNSEGRNYENVSYMSTSSTYPERGEMNNRRIYVPSAERSNNNKIGFYDLTSFEKSPVIRSSNWSYLGGACLFMDDDIVICVTEETGDIYKYNITNNYEQVKIASNNPSRWGFQSVLVTKDKKYILAAYYGCIYIYDSSGAYIGYSNNSQTQVYDVSQNYQMKEVRENIILTAEGLYVYSHDISNTGNIIIHKLLDFDNTKTRYYTLEVLEGNIGDIAIGGYYEPSGSRYGYVQLFHLDEDNSNLHPKSNKRWVGGIGCWIRIIREIQTGVIIFGGDDDCDICTWEYAVVPEKDPICFPLGEGRHIRDIMPLP